MGAERANGNGSGHAARRRSLRTLSRLAALIGTLVGLGVLTWLLLTIGALREANREAVSEGESLVALQDLETQLLLYSRAELLGDLGGPRAAIARRIRRLVDASIGSTQTRAEASSSRQLRRRVERYLATRGELAAREVPPMEALVASREAFDEAMAPIGALRTLRRANLERALERVDSIWRYTLGASVAVGALLFAGIAFAYAAFTRQVVGPLARLHERLRELRDGTAAAPAPEVGPSEVREIARAVNASAESIVRRRERQATFIAGVAHDLRTPLGALRMGLDHLKEDSAVAAKSGNLALVELLTRQAEHLVRMLDDLGEMATIESGRLSLECAWYDLRAAVREIVGLYRQTTTKHRLRLAVPSYPVVIWADPTRVEEVLGNLVSNAIKYSPAGGSITVSVEHRSSEAVVTVADEGVGISPDQLPNLFQAFARGRTSGEIARGSGLGLSVAQRIVTAHGGHIEVDTKPGEGSTFRACFPLPNQRAHAGSA